MTITIVMLAVGAVLTVASPWIPRLEQWGPLLLLWTVSGAHLAWIVNHEGHENHEGHKRL